MKKPAYSIVSLIFSGALLFGHGMAVAQQQDDQESASESQVIEEVVVTGSRITRDANLISNSPVVTVGADEFLYQGVVRVEDLLGDLPQVYGLQSSGQANGATGTATVSLRNLGTVRTLVLINGRRMPPGSPIQAGYAPDMNQIPGSLVERVEVLTGGASATYGSDAISGVVNFIMNDNFEGVRLEYQRSFYQHENDNDEWQDLLRANEYEIPDDSVSDGDVDSYSLVFGASLDEGRGNVTGYFTYRNIRAVLQGNRDYSACDLGRLADRCGGSGTIPQGRVTDFEGLDNKLVNINGVQTRLSGIDYIPSPDGTDFVDRDGLEFNYNPTNFYQRPDERYSAGFFAQYEVSENVELYGEFNFMDNHTDAQIAYSGAFFVTDDLFCGNPLLTDAQFAKVCGILGLDRTQFFSDAEVTHLNDNDEDGMIEDTEILLDADGNPVTSNPTISIGKRSVEGQPRSDNLRHTSFRGVLGARGEFDAWSYDIYAQYSEVSVERTYNNDVSTTRIIRALDVVEDADGNPVCRSVVDESDTNCVPWNIFRGPGLKDTVAEGITQAALDYLDIPLFLRGTTDQKVVSGYVLGSLGEYGIKSPYADSGISIVVGLEYRSESITYNPDQGFGSGDGAGQGGPVLSVAGDVDSTEFFMEASVPLVENRTLLRLLSLDVGYRFSDYSTDTETHTYKIAAQWVPFDDLRVRASLQRAIRHPNIRELFLPQGNNLFNGSDPCGGPVINGKIATQDDDGNDVEDPDGRTFEQCARSGVTQSQFGQIPISPADQYNFLQGGNENLEPEESDTYSVGFVYTPSVIPSLTVSLDYFDITVEKAIDNISPQTILNLCVDENLLCEFINRGRNVGDLWVGNGRGTTNNAYVEALQVNLGFFSAAGLDMSAEYRLDLGGWGGIRFTDSATFFTKWDQEELPGGGVEDCVGYWSGSCGDPTIQLVNNFRAAWHSPWNLTLSLAWRFLDAVESLDATEVDLDAVHYFDFSALFNTSFLGGNIALRSGINNLLDTEPPIIGKATAVYNNGNTFPGIYDALGRYIFLGATVTFQ